MREMRYKAPVRDERHPSHFYRMEDEVIYDESKIVVEATVFLAVRSTPKGVWVVPSHRLTRFNASPMPIYGSKKERFILDGEGRRYAYPTMELAIQSFEIRKRRQIQHLESQLEKAKAAHAWVKSPEFKPFVPHFDDTLVNWVSY